MGDPLGRLSPGQPLPRSARAWNSILGMARAHRRFGADLAGRALTTARSGHLVRVANDSGGDVGRFGVLGIAGPIFDPGTELDAFLREVVLSGATPTADHAGKFAILLEPAADGRIARAFVSGVTPVRLDVLDPADACAEVEPGETGQLVSAGSGSAQVLWKESDEGAYEGDGTGPQWALVRFGAPCEGGGDGPPPPPPLVECGACDTTLRRGPKVFSYSGGDVLMTWREPNPTFGLPGRWVGCQSRSMPGYFVDFPEINDCTPGEQEVPCEFVVACVGGAFRFAYSFFAGNLSGLCPFDSCGEFTLQQPNVRDCEDATEIVDPTTAGTLATCEPLLVEFPITAPGNNPWCEGPPVWFTDWFGDEQTATFSDA